MWVLWIFVLVGACKASIWLPRIKQYRFLAFTSHPRRMQFCASNKDILNLELLRPLLIRWWCTSVPAIECMLPFRDLPIWVSGLSFAVTKKLLGWVPLPNRSIVEPASLVMLFTKCTLNRLIWGKTKPSPTLPNVWGSLSPITLSGLRLFSFPWAVWFFHHPHHVPFTV